VCEGYFAGAKPTKKKMSARVDLQQLVDGLGPAQDLKVWASKIRPKHQVGEYTFDGKNAL
jgi:hypothetical protein